MFRQALKNTIEMALDRQPTEKELQLFEDELEGYYHDAEVENKNVYLVTIETWITEIRNNYFQQCQECGKYYLMASDEWNPYEDEPICRNCKDVPNPDLMPGGKDYPLGD